MKNEYVPNVKGGLTMNTCKNCKFCVNGECHRYPPNLNSPVSVLSRFPYIDPNTIWCGEFKVSENVINQRLTEIEKQIKTGKQSYAS